MDYLDKISIVAIAVLIIVAGWMLRNERINEGRSTNPGVTGESEGDSYATQMETNKKIYAAVTSYQDKGLHDEAIVELNRIVKTHPENSLSYVYLAESYLAEGRLLDAIRNYRRAVEMNPDYVDRRTPAYIGDELKKLVTEGVPKLERERKLKPEDEDVKQGLKDVYYLQRRLSGGCE